MALIPVKCHQENIAKSHNDLKKKTKNKIWSPIQGNLEASKVVG